MKTCRIDGCTKVVKRRTICYAHDYRLRRYGDPFKQPFPRIKFNLSSFPTDPTTGCILWPFSKSPKSGYARKKRNGFLTQVSRIVLEQKLGRPIGEGLHALHSCDNPPCINPEHLREGTVSANLKESWDKGRRKRILGPRLKHIP
jgi:hypothetical protein